MSELFDKQSECIKKSLKKFLGFMQAPHKKMLNENK